MSLEGFVEKQGQLVNLLPYFDLSTIQHSDEIIISTLDDTKLTGKVFWTADIAMYTADGGDASLCLARDSHNIIFKNCMEEMEMDKYKLASLGIWDEGNLGYRKPWLFPDKYVLGQKYIETVKEAESTLLVNISDPQLFKEFNPDISYSEISTDPHAKLTSAKKALAERVCGKGEYLEKSMKRLHENGINELLIYVANPNSVKGHYTVKNGGAIVRACTLDNSSITSTVFGAYGCKAAAFESPGMWLRGVPVVTDEAITAAYDTLLRNLPKSAGKMTPEIEEKMSAILQDYSDNKKNVINHRLHNFP